MPLLSTLLLALSLGADTVTQRGDSTTYATPALRALIAEAAVLNRRVPAGLGGYTAQLESEISIGNRRSEGMEMSVSLEQVASTLRWDRTGKYEQTVSGYRSQAVGASLSSLGFFASGWAIPSLYGNRIALLFGRDTTATARRQSRRGGTPLYAVHPLAADRERYYRFTGGDTVFTLRSGDREIPIVRVMVSLRENLPTKSVVFLGEIDLDASRRHLVRLRGYFAVVGGPKPQFDILREAGLQGIAYVEAVNAEAEGQFWLPARQRFEAHATSNTVSENRAVFRILTRFVDRELDPAPPGLDVGSEGDTLAIRPFRLAVAAPESLSAYTRWTRELGEMTAMASAEDFNDVAPEQWSTVGPPRFSVETERLGDVFRMDRVEGVYTGLGAVLRYRDAAPGLTLRGAVGWSWGEEEARGRAVVEYRRGRSLYALRAQRSLDLTNDFRNPYDSGSTVGALLGRDDYDYLDRRSVAAHWLHFFGPSQRTQLRLELGYASDDDVQVNLPRSPLGLGEDFRANRPVAQGTYARSALTLEYRPDVSLEFLRSGVGARLYVERAAGALDYQRAEARLTVRTNRGPFSLGARLDLGLTNPDAPPQQLFELGQNQNLPGYDYKEFAGNQAAVFRALALWRLPYLGAPIRLTNRFWVPPVAPSVALSVQSGWSGASTAAALATVGSLGSMPTGHPRTTVSLSLRFIGGAIGVGIAKRVDSPAPARLVLEFGQRP